MLDTQLIVQIYESDKDIDTLSKDLNIEPEMILKIRIGKYGSEHTKDLVPGMLLVRHRLRRQPNQFTQIELDYISKSSDLTSRPKTNLIADKESIRVMKRAGNGVCKSFSFSF